MKTGAQLGGRPLLPFFEDQEKWTDVEKKAVICVHLLVKLFIQNVASRVSKKQHNTKFLPAGLFLFLTKSAVITQNLPCPEKFLIAHLFMPIQRSYFEHFRKISVVKVKFWHNSRGT